MLTSEWPYKHFHIHQSFHEHMLVGNTKYNAGRKRQLDHAIQMLRLQQIRGQQQKLRLHQMPRQQQPEEEKITLKGAVKR